MRGAAVAVALGLGATAALGLGALRAAAPETSPQAPRAAAVVGPDRARLDAAIARGVGYLVRSQNPETGSWGKPGSSLWDIYAPVPGSYYAFEVAVTALAVSGILEATDDPATHDEAALAAARKGADFLLQNHRRA